LFVKERKRVENERAMEKIAKRTQKRDGQTEAAMAIGKKNAKKRERREKGDDGAFWPPTTGRGLKVQVVDR
jgi:hypothetical protein